MGVDAELHREENDLGYGHPGFDQQPTPRPVADDDECGRCGHPRWMHNGRGRCHRMAWVSNHACGCLYFLEIPVTSPYGGTASPKSGWHHRGYEDGFAGRPMRRRRSVGSVVEYGVPEEHWQTYLTAYRRGAERAERVKA